MSTTLSPSCTLENPSLSAGTAPIPPISNTGGNSQDARFSLIIDTLSVTGKFDEYPKDRYWFTDEDIINLINNDLAATLGLCMVGDHAGGKNGYKTSRNIGYTDGRPHKGLGFLAWGGNAGTYQLYLSGEAFEYINMLDAVPKLHKMLAYNKMKIKRYDTALDDFEGSKTVEDALNIYMNGGFTFTRSPSLSQVGDWTTGKDTKGRTVYIGNRKNGKLFRVYEKGKQLGDPESKWTRWELELKAVNREIPLDVLLDPVSYFASAYPCLASFVKASAEKVIKTTKKKAKIALDKLQDTAAKAYGKLFYVMRQMYSDTEILDKLTIVGVPERLKLPVPVMSINKAQNRVSSVVDQDIVTSEWGIV